MKSLLYTITLGLLFTILSSPAYSGPFAPDADDDETTAISMSQSDFIAWATGWTDLVYGERVTSTFKTPDKVLGSAKGDMFDTMSLGGGGTITLTFSRPVKNNPGWDFAVFENGFNNTFLELAFVEVSSNGSDFVRFDNYSLTETPVSEFGTLDPTYIDGLAGKYRIGYGTPFDLSDLALKDEVIDGTLDLSAVTHVKITDIVGDGNDTDSRSNPIYDPYPTNNSAGFDLEAVGVRYENNNASNTPPDAPQLGTPQHATTGEPLTPTLTIDSTSDSDSDDIHLLTRWQVATDASFQSSDRILDIYTRAHLKSLFIPGLIIDNSTTYHWRALVMDGPGAASDWSGSYTFSTTNQTSSTTISYRDWDDDGSTDSDIPSFTSTNSDGEDTIIGIQADANIYEIAKIQVYPLDDFNATDDTDSPDSFPAGLFGMKLILDDSSAPATLTIYLSEAADENAYWYTYDTIRGWQRDVYASFNSERNRVTLSLRDGTLTAGDNDGTDNGVIIMAGGLGIKTAGSTDTGGTGSGEEENEEEGIGEKGGCFITTVKPEKSRKHAFALALSMLLGIIWIIGRDHLGRLGAENKKKQGIPGGMDQKG